MISSLLNIAYLLVIPARAFFSAPQSSDQHGHGHGEAPMTCLIGMAVSSLMCIYLFFHPEPFYLLANMTSQGLITLAP
jgi:multicomponent Na+:H+ antiporter subunit D